MSDFSNKRFLFVKLKLRPFIDFIGKKILLKNSFLIYQEKSEEDFIISPFFFLSRMLNQTTDLIPLVQFSSTTRLVGF